MDLRRGRNKTNRIEVLKSDIAVKMFIHPSLHTLDDIDFAAFMGIKMEFECEFVWNQLEDVALNGTL